MRTRAAKVYLICLKIFIISLAGCRSNLLHEHRDDLGRLNKKDFETILQSPPPPLVQEEYRPRVSISTPPPLPAEMQKPISITATEATPIKDILVEMARQARVSLAVDPKITGSIILSAHNRPFIEVVSQIIRLAGLRKKLDHNTLIIELDTPYLVNYNVQFLTLSRQSENRIGVSTDVLSTTEGVKKVGDNGSDNVVTSVSKSDFWQEFENNLNTILTHSALAQLPQPPSLEGHPPYSIHKQGGLVAVFATEKQHRLVDEYLYKLRTVVSSQVLIEAKIIEVTLKEEFKSGINWYQVQGDVNFAASLGDIASVGHPNKETMAKKNLFSFALTGNNLASMVNMMETFGSTRTLSSPRLTVMNNRSAILKIAENEVYFRLRYDRTVSDKLQGGDVITTSSDIQTVPIGLILTVHPSINLETGDITMALRPTITSTTSTKGDPAVEIASNNTAISEVPIVQVREMDSVVHTHTGEVIVMGGLMQERSTSGEIGLPGIADIPLLGHLFKGQHELSRVVELVIFLKATIIKAPSIPSADDRLYKTFVHDPRPLYF